MADVISPVHGIIDDTGSRYPNEIGVVGQVTTTGVGALGKVGRAEDMAPKGGRATTADAGP